MEHAKEILIAASDPGGINNILPVVKILLSSRNNSITFLSSPERKDMLFSNLKDSTLVINWHFMEQESLFEVEQIFTQHNFKFLLAGTSGHRNLEKLCNITANKCKVPNLTLLDFWSFYRERLGIDDINYGASAQPQFLNAIDLICYDELISAGIKTSQITHYGSPYFEELIIAAKTGSKHHQIKSDYLLIGFVSSPRSLLHEKGWPHCGFDEYSSLETLINAIKKQISHINAKLIIKPHPREQFEKYAPYTGLSNEHLQIEVCPVSVSNSDFIQSCDIVTGMDSVLIFEAALIGKQTLSVQPNLIGPDKLKTNLLKITTPAYSMEQVCEHLAKSVESNTNLSSDNPALNQLIEFTEGATQKIARHIEHAMHQSEVNFGK